MKYSRKGKLSLPNLNVWAKRHKFQYMQNKILLLDDCKSLFVLFEIKLSTTHFHVKPFLFNFSDKFLQLFGKSWMRLDCDLE